MHVSLEVSSRRHFFSDTLSKPTQSCTVCAKEKSHLSFVSTNSLIWGFHSWVSSRSPQKPGETQEMHVGPSISPSSAEAHLIPHGLCVFSQWGHMHKSRGERRVQVCQSINSQQDRQPHHCHEDLRCCLPHVLLQEYNTANRLLEDLKLQTRTLRFEPLGLCRKHETCSALRLKL